MSNIVTLRLTRKQEKILTRWLIRNISYIEDCATEFTSEARELESILRKLIKAGSNG